jgi:hypothetical protein
MKKNFYWMFAAVALLSVLSWTGYSQKESPRAATWQYLTVSTGDAKYRDAKGMNTLGWQGWELVSVGTTDNAGNAQLYFKRPVNLGR